MGHSKYYRNLSEFFCLPGALFTTKLTIHQNGGHCQPAFYTAFPEIGEFEFRNYQTLKDLVEIHDVQCDWKLVSGCHSFMNKDMFLDASKVVKSVQEKHPEQAKFIRIITKESQNPSLVDLRIPTAEGAFLQTHAASLWPYKLVSWMLETLLSSNKPGGPQFNLQTNTPVTQLQNSDGSWIVHTPRGMIAASKVLLTTNGYTSHLLPQFSDLIVPVRGEMSSLIPPPSMSPASSTHQPLQYTYGFIGNDKSNVNQDDYLVQRPFTSTSSDDKEKGGELMFGGGRSYAANAGLDVSDDSSIDLPAAAYLRRELNVVLDLQSDEPELEASFEWSGIMGYSRDGHPWVGEVSEKLGGADGLWICAGFTGHGMPNTVLSAKTAALEMMGGREDIPDCYRLSDERVERARALDEVAVADEKGLL